MSNVPAPTPEKPKPPRVPPALIGAGVLVIALGFGLPMLTSSAPEPAAPAPAGKLHSPAPIQPPSGAGLVASLAKLAAGLAVVCGLCVLAARYAGPKAPPAPGAMDVVASIVVAQCVLHLVKAGDRRLLIGTDLAGVKAVLELPGPGPDPAPAPAPSAPDAPAPISQDELLNLLLRLRAQTAAPPPG